MSTTLTPAVAAERRTDLDWIRIIAFGLLILYHVACFYASMTPHNQVLSTRPINWLAAPMLALNPWRLLILFIVSGAATRFMADKMSAGALFKSRAGRLLPPLLLGITVIVPPQCYFAMIQWMGYRADYLSFMGYYFTSNPRDCVIHHCVPTPSYAHLWFVAYLFVYTALLTALMAAAPGLLRALQRGLEFALRGPGLIVWPAAYLIAAQIITGAHGQNGTLVNDWYGHAIYVGGFLFGFALAKSDAIWRRFEAMRGRTLAAALATYAAIIGLGVLLLGADFNWSPKLAAASSAAHGGVNWADIGESVILGADQWLWIAAMFGFAHRYLSNADGPVRRYLTDAIFPYYIIHQTTIAVAGYYLMQLALPQGEEAALLIGATALSCVLTYEIVRRVGFLRPWFGLKALARKPAPSVPQISALTPMYER